MKMPAIASSILITGASGGLGAALAKHYARRGVHLALFGREAGRLEAVAQACRALGAEVSLHRCDVRDAQAMRDAVLACDHARPVTLVIANAGVSAGAGEEGESEAQLRAVMAVNLDGVLNTVLPLIPPMRARGRGQIALIGSLAGLRGLPSCPAYSASKMAVRALAEAWRGAYRRDGIRVCCVCPGYIATPMTKDNAFPMPFLMSAEKAARLIARGLAKDRGRIAFPLRLYLPLWWLCCLPVRLTERFFAGLPRKNAMKTEEAAL